MHNSVTKQLIKRHLSNTNKLKLFYYDNFKFKLNTGEQKKNSICKLCKHKKITMERI